MDSPTTIDRRPGGRSVAILAAALVAAGGLRTAAARPWQTPTGVALVCDVLAPLVLALAARHATTARADGLFTWRGRSSVRACVVGAAGFVLALGTATVAALAVTAVLLSPLLHQQVVDASGWTEYRPIPLPDHGIGVNFSDASLVGPSPFGPAALAALRSVGRWVADLTSLVVLDALLVTAIVPALVRERRAAVVLSAITVGAFALLPILDVADGIGRDTVAVCWLVLVLYGGLGAVLARRDSWWAPLTYFATGSICLVAVPSLLTLPLLHHVADP